ncbi:MAG TPA: GH92 family glycosyl hydrolase [Pyrinomonadaceae bacterium]|jgi:putative alpha-1,2-mannosidase
MKKPILVFLPGLVFFVFLSANLFAQTKDYTRYVNPFVGTGGHGHTFPGATVPFGFVQLSPDTRMDDWDGSSGYHYSDNQIYGFSHTHLSGTGIPDYCDILFAPTAGEPEFFARKGDLSENGYASAFSHQNEKAEAGYYSVKLDEGNILAEMTATARVGFHRYTFPAGGDANLILDLKHRDKVLDSELRITGANRIEGFRRSSSWAKDQIVYFAAEFSEPFTDYGVVLDDSGAPEKIDKSKGKNIKAFFRFAAKKPLLVKVSISPVGISGARRNLLTEIPQWDFEKVRRDAKDIWNKELSKIEVSGDNPEQLTNFYTALYHTMIAPNVFQDTDKSYVGVDREVHSAQDYTNYTVFSLWDTFRAAHPLYTIIDRRRTADFINTFLKQYEQGGRLPVWEFAANETDTMIGYHAVSVIADAMAKGIEGFDYDKAYEAAKHSAELNHFGLEAYKRRGYISMEDEQESVSKTLEYAYNDYCILLMAGVLMDRERVKLAKIVQAKQAKGEKFDGEKDAPPEHEAKRKMLLGDTDKYRKRSLYYKNLFDAETGFMRPRQNGGFVSPFKPNEVTFHFTEGNSWQYSFFVPHDVSGLIDLHGGQANFAGKLDQLFTTKQELAGREQPDITGLIGQYAHGNEPSHHIAYLYNYAGEPWKTQFYARKIMDEFYKPTPDGLIGNEDCGQMSAWYVLSALGFYQVAPGRDVYDLGTPLFKEAKIHLENGKTFVVKAPNVSDKNIYVKSVKLNGNEHRKTVFAHRDLSALGGTLEFEMTDSPDKTWFNDFFVSGGSGDGGGNFVSVPIIEAKDRVFEKKTSVSLRSVAPRAKIFYTTDGSEPSAKSRRYRKPFTIAETSVVKAISINPKGEKSFVVESKLNKMPHDWTLKLFSEYNRQYTGGGAQGLIDGIRGTTNFASGEWQGYQAQDFVVVIDLKKETEIRKLGGGFLQVARSWIWMPTRVEFEISNDNVNFTKVADIKTDVSPEDMEHRIRDYKIEIAPAKARYVRVKAYNLGKIPAWHPGAGFDAFIFVDEIFIE